MYAAFVDVDDATSPQNILGQILKPLDMPIAPAQDAVERTLAKVDLKQVVKQFLQSLVRQLILT